MRDVVRLEVEVHADDLIDAGWHHEDECPDDETVGTRLLLFCDALHRAAHGEYPWRSADCAQQPCRSLHEGAEEPWPA